MQGFQNRVDRFLWKHPNFGIRNLMLYIVIGNALIYLLSMMDRSSTLIYYLVFSADRVLHGEVWRLVSFVFVPRTSSILGLVLMLYFEYFIGRLLEQAWGKGKFTVYYLLGMAFIILYSFAVRLIFGRDIMSDATYLNLSMFFVFATLWPENRVLLFFIIPIKVTWLAYAEAILYLYIMISGRTLLPLIGILNYFLFCGDELYYRIQPLFRRFFGHGAEFRRSAKQAQRDAKALPYIYKCAVCGRTDTDYPELEFRYCSRCVGYHCFCEDHINSHVHFTS
ncbi:MAG: hypothetical protein J5633_09010 [Oscillospiraceae bacterium]|nr:hypothetical protein [Oscillospiraceae bacterium]